MRVVVGFADVLSVCLGETYAVADRVELDRVGLFAG